MRLAIGIRGIIAPRKTAQVSCAGLVLLLVACAGPDATVTQAATPQEPTARDDGLRILVSKPVPNHTGICLQTYLHTTDETVRANLTSYLVESFKSAGFNGVTLTPSARDAKRCLTAMARTTRGGEAKQTFQVSLLDPATRGAVFDAINTRVVWLSYPKELYDPVFAALKTWKGGMSP